MLGIPPSAEDQSYLPEWARFQSKLGHFPSQGFLLSGRHTKNISLPETCLSVSDPLTALQTPVGERGMPGARPEVQLEKQDEHAAKPSSTPPRPLFTRELPWP